MFNNIYKDKVVLVTGHTGFKGGWLSLWLNELGAKVWGFSNGVPTEPSFYEILDRRIFAGEINGDISNCESIRSAIKKIKPDFIFHLAAQSLVRVGYEKPLETVHTNIIGTVNLLESVRIENIPCDILVITSDKCYENRGWEYGYREVDALGGYDPYSASKAAAEIVTHAWYRSYFMEESRLGKIATGRAGNVIGGGDYAKDRIVPDAVRALIAGKPIPVRNPDATRPWQHVLDCLSGYLWLGACLQKSDKGSQYVGAFNFGPPLASNRTVKELVEEILKTWHGEWRHVEEKNAPHEATYLYVASDKAFNVLKWKSTWDFAKSVYQSADWYLRRHQIKESQMMGYSIHQIEQYCDDARRTGQVWTR
ncbi:MAG: CDP-glucose 4,6-dehydratase [Verrucomicrobiae bacterium]|nr:CDP-glucose 4,6-dehydratase [Verrucomicrobiae bacterium]